MKFGLSLQLAVAAGHNAIRGSGPARSTRSLIAERVFPINAPTVDAILIENLLLSTPSPHEHAQAQIFLQAPFFLV
jgi:hypothetical protein